MGGRRWVAAGKMGLKSPAATPSLAGHTNQSARRQPQAKGLMITTGIGAGRQTLMQYNINHEQSAYDDVRKRCRLHLP
jgi:hypothetical protein